MTVIVFLFVTLLSAALQATIPTLVWTGHATMPFLLSVVIYYALTHRIGRVAPAAVMVGLLADSLGMLPLGFHAFCYAVAGLVIAQFRGSMAVRAWTTHAFLGASANLLVTLAAWVLLAVDGDLQWPLPWLLLRFAGSLLTGALVTPILFAAMSRLDHRLGNLDLREASPL